MKLAQLAKHSGVDGTLSIDSRGPFFTHVLVMLPYFVDKEKVPCFSSQVRLLLVDTLHMNPASYSVS